MRSVPLHAILRWEPRATGALTTNGMACAGAQAPARGGSGPGRTGPERADIQTGMVEGLRDEKDRRVVISVAPLRRDRTVAACCRPPLCIGCLGRPGAGCFTMALPKLPPNPMYPRAQLVPTAKEASLRSWAKLFCAPGSVVMAITMMIVEIRYNVTGFSPNVRRMIAPLSPQCFGKQKVNICAI